MAANYVLLQRIELNASAASVTFSNIPQSGYTDLKVVISGRSGSWGYSYNNLNMAINGSPGGTAYSDKVLYSVGTSAGSLGHTGTDELLVGATPSTAGTSNTFSNTEIYITNYSSSSAYKSISSDGVAERNSSTNGDIFLNMTAGLWASNSPITSLVFTTDVTSFEPYTTFSLYGLAATGTEPVIAPKATGGNITNDGTYWIHTFTSSGTFTPLTGLSCDYLVVAGGAGGGLNSGGGGGAGGLRSTVTATGGGGSLESVLSVASGTAYTIQVGAGGAAAPNDTSESVNGSNSIFSTITSIGGGGSTPYNSGVGGKSGGSGGGSNGSGTGAQGNTYAGGAGTANQGYAGGSGWQNGPGAYNQRGGGGGGAGAVGVTATNTVTPNGGNGVAVAISGTSVTYAGGGGGAGFNYTGGSGGTGGGGAGNIGGNNNAATSATANTGGGGGGAMYGTGGNGGSGIVVIRYPIA